MTVLGEFLNLKCSSVLLLLFSQYKHGPLLNFPEAVAASIAMNDKIMGKKAV